MFSLKGKKSLVTGAATGLGQAIALALAEQGADLVVTDKSLALLGETAEKLRPLGCQVASLGIDMRNFAKLRKASPRRFRNWARSTFSSTTPASIAPRRFSRMRESEWDDHFQTNVKGGFFMAQAVAPQMIEHGWGRIIFISSQSGVVGIPGQPIYCATKGAIIQLVRTLGLEWAKFGITVNSVAPDVRRDESYPQETPRPRVFAIRARKNPRRQAGHSARHRSGGGVSSQRRSGHGQLRDPAGQRRLDGLVTRKRSVDRTRTYGAVPCCLRAKSRFRRAPSWLGLASSTLRKWTIASASLPCRPRIAPKALWASA